MHASRLLFRGIIKHMRQKIDVYRFVKMVNSGSESLDDKNPTLFKMSGYDIWEPATKSVKQEYIKEYKRTTVNKVNGICADAQKLGYLHGDTNNESGEPIDIVCLTTEGRNLIGKVFGIPWTLIELILSEQKQTFVFISGIISTGIAYGIWRIIKFAFHL